MSDKKHVGDIGVKCPDCGEVINVGVFVEIVTTASRGQEFITESDTNDLWAHYEMHEIGAPMLTTEQLLERAENRITRALSVLEGIPGYAAGATWRAVEILRGTND